jgi:hypothetical protein
MSDGSPADHRRQCMRKCRQAFIEYTETKPVGGVEAPRICRENCDGAYRKRLGSMGGTAVTSKDKQPE